MRLPSLPTLPMVEHLNSAYFKELWNAPNDHGRANFQLYKAAQRLQIGSVPVNLSVVGLPTTDKVYAVYRVNIGVFGRFVTFPATHWITDSDILANEAVAMTVYDSNGRVIPTGCIHLRYDPLRSLVLVAIEYTYTVGCISNSYPDLYMTVYRDSTRATPLITQTFVVSNTFGAVVTVASVNQAIQAAKTQYPAGTMVYVNGWMYDPANVPTLFLGDIVQIMSDPDIAGYCDLSVDDNQTGYYSTMYGEYREILHIPKLLNPHNYIITHETLSIGVFDLQTHRGVYGHRLDIHGIESITHNDFSMSRSVLQAFENGLSAQGISVRLYVRFAPKPLKLMGDINRMEDLYTQTDDEIKAQLAGLSTHQIMEWKAAHLEQSSFLPLLYAFPGFGSTDVLTQYTNAMGYYDVASTLSQSVHYYTYKGAQVEIEKPARLIGYPCSVIVYANGLKVPDSFVGLNEVSSRSFSLGFKAGSYVALNARICVYITEAGSRIPIKFQPLVTSPSITLNSDDYQLFKVTNYSTPQPIWNGTASSGYVAIPVSPGDYHVTVNTNGTATYSVGSVHYGDTLYLAPICGKVTSSYSLDSFLTANQPIIIPLQMTDSAGAVIPLIGERTLEVYINGSRLIEGIDYTCNPVMGPNADILQTLLEVSNADYLGLGSTGNILETVIHGDSVASEDKGYVIANMMHRTQPPMIWSKSCGRAFAHGKLIDHVYETGNTLVATTTVADGAPYLLQWSLPYGVGKLMANQSMNADTQLRTRIDAVLGYTAVMYPSTVVISHLYALYSPYLAKIVSDVASGNLTIVNEPKDDQFLKQFSTYSILYDRDPIVGVANPLIDRRFVTLAAHYVNLAVQNPQQMILVQRLITLLLTPSQLSINEVLV